MAGGVRRLRTVGKTGPRGVNRGPRGLFHGESLGGVVVS